MPFSIIPSPKKAHDKKTQYRFHDYRLYALKDKVGFTFPGYVGETGVPYAVKDVIDGFYTVGVLVIEFRDKITRCHYDIYKLPVLFK